METPVKYETAEGEDKILQEALNRFQEVYGKEETTRQFSMEDKVFNSAHGGQWDSVDGNRGTFKTGVTGDGYGSDDERPKFQVNVGNAIIKKMLSEMRETDIGPQVFPNGNGATRETAETLEGLIRSIENRSKAEDSYGNAYNEILQGGYGGFQITTSYVDDDVFEQELGVEPIYDATSSLYFGPSKYYDKRDAPWAFLAFDMDKDVFKATYPDAQDVSVARFTKEANNENWCGDDTIRLAVYWRRRSVKKTIVQLQYQEEDVYALPGVTMPSEDVRKVLEKRGGFEHLDGIVEDLSDIESVLDELGMFGVTIANQREVETYQLERYLMNGVEILDKKLDYKGRYIPLVPVYGERIVIAGAEIFHGLIRFTKDAAKAFNFAFSAIIERAALGPGEFYWMTPEQMAGHQDDYSNMNTDRKGVRQYNARNEDGEFLPESQTPPQSTQPANIPPALIATMTEAYRNIYAVMGTTGQTATDGTAMDNRSGEAILASGAIQDVGNSLYFDNLIKSIEHGYRIMIDLMPHTMDTERQERILNPDGTTDFVPINTVIDGVMVNDLSIGKYGVTAKSGPAFATKRQETVDGLLRLATESEEFRNLAEDLIVENMDGPAMATMAERIKRQKFLNGTLVPTEEEAEEFGINRDQALIESMRPQIEQEVLEQANTQLIVSQTAAYNAQAESFRAGAMKSGAQAQEIESESMREETRLLYEKINSISSAVEKLAKAESYEEGEQVPGLMATVQADFEYDPQMGVLRAANANG